MSEKTTQSLMSQWTTLLAETDRLLKVKDNQIRELNNKLKEQKIKLFLSKKSNGERAAELKRARVMIKNIEQKLVPETASKNEPASKQSPLKRHLKADSKAGPSQKFKCLNPVNEEPHKSNSKNLKRVDSSPANNAQQIADPGLKCGKP
ncbi:hypothetical protein DdX_16414 [Ditylenchus destructor]|uniref:Uncharacterized protein n=1 Tax=Ditylenchus destructor TaxID=166010 RepID=A0AAD4MQE3_9BILA|nr:hypothetical protein DdX_16414 [Ditylenchus destructor]